MSEKQSVFETLSKIDVSNHVETIKMKRGPALKYVSWAWAWSMVKQAYPQATRKINEFPEYAFDQNTGRWYATGQSLDYRITPAGCEVSVTVTIDGEEYTERLYVMDMRNQPVKDPNISQINKTQQRCLVKALAMAGLGLNLYAGEDLPMGDIAENDKEQADQKRQQKQQAEQKRQEQFEQHVAAINKEYDDKFAEALKVTGLAPRDLKNKLINSAQKKKPEYNRLTDYQQKEYLIALINRSLEKGKEKQSA